MHVIRHMRRRTHVCHHVGHGLEEKLVTAHDYVLTDREQISNTLGTH